MWLWLAAAVVVSYATKLAGYLVPTRLLDSPWMTRILGALTVGLLAGLTALNTFATGQSIELDARLGALVAAVIALLLRAPFIVVVLAGVAAAALLRLLGWD